MAMAGNTGITLLPPPAPPAPHAFWFGEDQARYIAATNDAATLLAAAEQAAIPARRLGRTGGESLTLHDGATISYKRLRELHEAFFPAWMNT
jgi:phosphoribosylformylglycinamidine synthase